MTNRFYPDKQIRNTQVARPVSSRIFVWLTVIALAGALLSCGFVISARQHFQAISVGYQNEELRRQAAQLEEKRRQLELEYARLASPVEIERRAQKIGLAQPQNQSNNISNNIRRPANTGVHPKR
jgi:cell division protein FtsL